MDPFLPSEKASKYYPRKMQVEAAQFFAKDYADFWADLITTTLADNGVIKFWLPVTPYHSVAVYDGAYIVRDYKGMYVLSSRVFKRLFSMLSVIDGGAA